MDQPLILVTGATGHIGSRLVPRLLQSGRRVRVMVRHRRGLEVHAWADRVEVVEADVLQPGSLTAALSGVDTAYYLIHSLAEGSDFHRRDVQAARDFGIAAGEAGVRRIIYLGGLGDPDDALSAHLASRQQTGAALRESGIPVTEFRAAVIVGAGSLSFEMVRYLTEHIPLMICPRWVYTRIQPLAITNCLDYLEAALDQPLSAGRTIEIGGEQVLTYGEMMIGYAEVRGLRRWLLPVPVLTPRLSSYWVHLVTPISAEIAQPLIEGLRNEVVVREQLALQLFPDVELLDYRTAVELALAESESPGLNRVSLPTSDDGSPAVTWSQGVVIEQRSLSTSLSASSLYQAFSSLGGESGWPALDWAWSIRGALDRLVGGVGLRRQARPRGDLHAGDPLDFWTVERIERPGLMRLRADMKLPGRAWLEFEVRPGIAGERLFIQRAIFEPKGLPGVLYWLLLYPIHKLIFGRMHRNLEQQAAMIEAHPRHTSAEALVDPDLEQ